MGGSAIAAYLRDLRHISRDVKLYMLAYGIFGFTLMNGIYPVLFNLYLLRLGHGPEFVGTVNFAGLLAMAISAMPAGAMSRRWGIRRTMVIGLAMATVFYGLQTMVHLVPASLRVPGMLVVRMLGSVGVSLFVVNSIPFLMHASRPEERSGVFSLNVVASQMLGLTGSLVGGTLPRLIAGIKGVSLEDPIPYRYPLLLAAILGVLAAVVLAQAGEQSAEQATGGSKRHHQSPAPIKLVALLAISAMLQTAVVGACKTFFNVYLDDHLSVDTARIGQVYAVVQLLSAGAAMVMPRMAARWGAYSVLVASSVGSALGMLPLALIPTWGAALFGRTTVSAFASIAFPALSVMQMELVSAEWRSLMSGAVSMTKQVMWMLLSLAGGYIISSLGYRTLFLAGMALTLAGTALFALYFGVPRGELVVKPLPARGSPVPQQAAEGACTDD